MESLDLDLLSDFHMLDQLCTPSLGGWVGEVTKKIGKEQKEDSGEKTRHSHTHMHTHTQAQ